MNPEPIERVTTLIIATRNRHKVLEIQAVLGSRLYYQTLNDYPSAPAVVEDVDTFEGNATKKSVQLAQWLAGNPRVLAQHLQPRANRPESRARTTAMAADAAAVQTQPERVSFTPDFLVVADDSGLEVDVLQGAPGVHSARFAALDTGSPGNSTDQQNNSKLLRLLEGFPLDQRTARFRCVLALTPVILSRSSSESSPCYADEAELRTELYSGVCEGRILASPRGAHGFGYDPLFVPEGFAQTFAELGDEAKNRISHRARALSKLQQALNLAP